MTSRTDAHRPSTIIPANYAERMWYSLAHEAEGWPQPPINIDAVIEIQHAAREAGRSMFGSLGKCGVCGAHFKHGTLFVHEPTGDLVHMGYDCAAKYECMVDESAAELERARVHAATAKAITRERNDAERAAFLDAHPGLAADLELGKLSAKDAGIAEDEYRTLGGHAILADLAAKFTTWRTMSDKQIALAAKLANEIRTPRAQRPIDVKAPALTGKGVTFTGEIVSVKLKYSEQWGASWKCTVKVTNEDGSIWLAWGSVPRSLLDLAMETEAYRKANRDGIERAIAGELRGLHVDVKATLEGSREQRSECYACSGCGYCTVDDYELTGERTKTGKPMYRSVSRRETCTKCNGTGEIVKAADASFAFMTRPSMTVAGMYNHPVQRKPRKAKAVAPSEVTE